MQSKIRSISRMVAIKPLLLGILSFFLGILFLFFSFKKIKIFGIQTFDQILWIGVSLMFFSIANVLIIYGRNKEYFWQKYSMNLDYISSLEEERATKSLFIESLQLLLLFLAIILVALLFVWLQNLLGSWVIWIFCLLLIAYTAKALYKQKGFIIFHIIYVPLMVFYLIGGPIIFAGILGSAVFIPTFWAINSKKLKRKKSLLSGKHLELLSLVKRIKILNSELNKKIYGRGTLQFFKAFSIILVALFFIIGPFFANYLPSKYDKLVNDYSNLVQRGWNLIPYLAFIFYMTISTVPLLDFFVRPVSFANDESSALKRGGNFLMIIVIAFSILPIFSVFSIFISLVIVALGDTALGKGFAIILGFFIFPNWVTKFFSIIPTLSLFIYPQKMLSKWIK